jgi:hypothetical protein
MNTVETDVRLTAAMLDTPTPQQLMQSVLSCTSILVHDAMHGNWGKVLDGVDQRRHYLQRLLDSNEMAHNASVLALQAAVDESERAIVRVVAHAIASSRWHGAIFALRH